MIFGFLVCIDRAGLGFVAGRRGDYGFIVDLARYLERL